MFKLWAADAFDDAESLPFRPDGQDVSAGSVPGTVAFADKKQIFIRTGRGFLKPLEVQLEGKKRMAMEEFLRGRKIEQGYRFG